MFPISDHKIAYIFPGQGSQAVGMGKYLNDNYSSAKAIFEEADDTLNFSLSKLCFEGPEDELTRTLNVQPAILTTSFACLKVSQQISSNKLPAAVVAAGHSLGEYTALLYAGVLSFHDALTLVRERGRLMNEAGKKNPGGMLAILGSDEIKVAELCSKTNTEISNINCPGQIVISGSLDDLATSKKLGAEMGIRRMLHLNVSGAFHSRLMQPAAEGMKEIVSNIVFKEPAVQVISNVTAKELSGSNDIKSELIEQVTKCVQWQKSVEYIIGQKIDDFIEFGHGQVLAGLIKRINPDVRMHNIDDISIENQISTIMLAK
jgi:[acyl-carrier-protein] S-malonyltransferase